MLNTRNIIIVFESKDPCAVENFLKGHDFTTSKGIVYVGYKQALWRHISPKAAYNNVTLCYGVPASFSSDNNYYWDQTPPNVVFLHTVHNVSDSSLLLSYHILYTALHKFMIQSDNIICMSLLYALKQTTKIQAFQLVLCFYCYSKLNMLYD